MKAHAFSIAAAVAALAAPISAHAVVYDLQAFLIGANEAPPVATPATGYATLVWDDVLHTATLDVSWSGLLGTTTVAHIHSPTANPAAPTFPVATTAPSFPAFPVGVTAGSYHLVFATDAASSYSSGFLTFHGGDVAAAEAALLSGILAGQAYLNIHSSFAPGGEIRAPFQAVPEPSTWALTIGGFGAVGWAMRSRRRSLATG